MKRTGELTHWILVRGLWLALLVGLVGLAGCDQLATVLPIGELTGGNPVVQVATAGPSRTPFQAEPPTPTPLPPTPTATPEALAISLHPALPQSVRASLHLPAGVLISAEAPGVLPLAPGDAGLLAARWVYALVAPFPSLVDGVSAAELRQSWLGESAGAFGGQPLLLAPDTYEAWKTLWGEAAPGAVEILDGAALLETAWSRASAWALVPFDALEPRWKVLQVDGISPIQQDFDPATSAYALTLPVSLLGDPALITAELSRFGVDAAALLPASNRDSGRFTSVMLTGVTALVRATAHLMEIKSISHPGLDIGDWLRGADILHISNEVPFAEDCPFPDPLQPELRFCSRTKYIGLLEEVGTDVIELTGDHFGDWGAQAMRYTLALYNERGWPYYGGGENLEDGRKPLLLEHNGNKIAFIGCNAKGGGYATASATNPGAVACDFPYMESEISRLQSEGYLVIATFQHFEYYQYPARPDQIEDSQRLMAAGAAIVSGSQAHQPQAFEFYANGLIHYGLGNLFFDQLLVSPDTAIAFIDRHIFYDGRYISTELLTIKFIDYARARPMTADERAALLFTTFSASGW